MKKLMVLMSSIFLLQMNVSLAQSVVHSTVKSFQECFNAAVTDEDSGLKGAFNFTYESLTPRTIGYSKSKDSSRRHRLENVSMLEVTILGVANHNVSINLINGEDEIVRDLAVRCRNSIKEDIQIIEIDSYPAVKSLLIGKGKNRYIVSFFSSVEY
jgi:hypothetical protein